jgi:hypothetical protein
VFVCLLSFVSVNVQATEYIKPADFIKNSFEGNPSIKSIWIKEDQQTVAKSIFGHTYQGLRVRYWQLGSKTTWILDEIGKEQPITVGIVIDQNRIEKVAILAFREYRGGEVRHAFFTKQFVDATIDQEHELDTNIDGISGATLSVRAVSRVSRYALYLHSLVQAV